MFYLTTDKGNLFIRAMSGDTEIYFFMNQNGRHLKSPRAFHEHSEYLDAYETWQCNEAPVPEHLTEQAQRIVDLCRNGQQLIETFAPNESKGNNLGDALLKALVKK
ncbi:MAG: hypothetical protein KBB70_02970 [Candidatus Pacebacteria bacterium]|jgi:hypothetical protein|nr:hypothetical protein [Candidatus Paceibacterota bacterium]